MTKGTTSKGPAANKTHMLCRRCAKHAFHITKKVCASCGYGATASMRQYGQQYKAIRRRTTGTGRMRYMKTLSRRFKNGFREGTTAQKKTSA
mmetsp:Transcript_3559/g.6064  ORF Transcript_3559/g.6064 Transcript_3559/m.6064 type:complete len:92 (+) Transcript_3559:22-297(+)|eukprot:CAMPEP_0116857328 /NCGR_PEP_ID=MMETSP0418-20121206/20482_1 /TAXON_ID=1158023 /ORGANISM="Astrosyne radiata, Strain 13vi08-1A" /LENGTH=91 /DNA_ID=CAMNT_0004490979 /DNA_START=27 /DNA_END=302 /DNA_ORIENTATION=-